MKGTRRRLSASSWREALQRFGQAGETVVDFCAREGLCVSSFYRWRSLLAKPHEVVGARSARGARASIPALTRAAPEAVGFIDMGSLGGTGRHDTAAGALELRLDLGGGVVLQIVRR
jgi:hypothetical protein